MTPDIANALFELLGAGLIALNCRAVYYDKRVAGVRATPTAFFTAWGLWNLYFYPSVGAWWSTAAGAVMVLANTCYVILLVLYSKVWRTNQTSTTEPFRPSSQSDTFAA